MKVNIIGIILFITGIIVLIVGVFNAYQSSNYGNPIADDPYATTMDWSVFFMMLSGPVLFGMVFIGISEVIRLLHKQQLTLSNNNGMKHLEKIDLAKETEETADVWAVSKADEEKIYELY